VSQFERDGGCRGGICNRVKRMTFVPMDLEMRAGEDLKFKVFMTRDEVRTMLEKIIAERIGTHCISCRNYKKGRPWVYKYDDEWEEIYRIEDEAAIVAQDING